jgi:hypothetical protein
MSCRLSFISDRNSRLLLTCLLVLKSSLRVVMPFVFNPLCLITVVVCPISPSQMSPVCPVLLVWSFMFIHDCRLPSLFLSADYGPSVVFSLVSPKKLCLYSEVIPGELLPGLCVLFILDSINNGCLFSCFFTYIQQAAVCVRACVCLCVR